MRRISPVPVSSDEGAESGEDSDEDIITNHFVQNTQPPQPQPQPRQSPNHHSKPPHNHSTTNMRNSSPLRHQPRNPHSPPHYSTTPQQQASPVKYTTSPQHHQRQYQYQHQPHHHSHPPPLQYTGVMGPVNPPSSGPRTGSYDQQYYQSAQQSHGPVQHHGPSPQQYSGSYQGSQHVMYQNPQQYQQPPMPPAQHYQHAGHMPSQHYQHTGQHYQHTGQPVVTGQHYSSSQANHVHNHGGRRLVRMAELPTMDSVTACESLGVDPHTSSGAQHMYQSGGDNSFVPPIPTISITPHSPIVNKPFAVLEDNIRQLQSLQDNIQKMRDTTLSVKNGRALSRLSSSCPSLNVDGEEIDPSSPSHSSQAPPPWSEEFLLDTRKGGAAGMMDTQRRRSWSGLSDTEKKRQRQRSVSLSSLDSDTEAFYDAEESSHSGAPRNHHTDKPRSLSGSSSPGGTHGGGGSGAPGGGGVSAPRGSSTHSLNDVHLDKKGGAPSSSTAHDKPRLLAPRLTLQKSISTPSILANITAQQQQQPPYPDEEDQGSSKRRKRGSIFSRKKKEKVRKTFHQFVPVCFSNSSTCDVCSKSMANKPALRCEVCLMSVHEHYCKESIPDCTKVKSNKMLTKHGGVMPLSSSAKSSSLGSHPSNSTSSIIFNAAGLPTGKQSHYSRGNVPRPRGSIGSYHSSSPTRPISLNTLGNSASPVRRLSGLSQWKKVATKLGVNSKLMNEERDPDFHHEASDNNILDVNSASMESLDDGENESTSVMDDIDGDPDLRLIDDEPELWVHTVDKSVVERLTDKQVQKQEHIYELIITEKHHCRMLKIIQKVFIEGMQRQYRELEISQTDIKRVFPCIDELLTIHCSFLWRLRQRQRENKVIESIGDLVLEEFIGDNAQGLKDSYGLLCSQHLDAMALFKDMCKTKRRFQAFVHQHYDHPFLKKKEIPEIILFISQRVTKYPLMVEALIKFSKDNEKERNTLIESLEKIKEILVDINSQVADKERSERLLEIYNRIDAKSSITYKDLKKFKKSDLLSNNRHLKFEGQAYLRQEKGKPLFVIVVVMSDLVFFVQENNQKYYFVSPDNKTGAIPLDKLLVREKASSGDSRCLFFIFNKKNQEILIELECHHPLDKKIWMETIRVAAENCPDEVDDAGDGGAGNAERLRALLSMLQHKDRDIARVCEEKESCLNRILAEMGQGEVENLYPSYQEFLDENKISPPEARKLQISALNDALKLVTGACGWGSGLARSVSSVGEHQSEAYVSPSLPKRAETFGGFDNNNKDAAVAAQQQAKQTGSSSHPPAAPSKKSKKENKLSLADEGDGSGKRRASASLLAPRSSQDNLSIMSSISSEMSTVVGSVQDLANQQETATRLMNHLHLALVLSQHHITQLELMLRGAGQTSDSEARFRHSQKLEELRNFQEQLSHKRHKWTKERDHQEKWIEDKKTELKTREEKMEAHFKMREEQLRKQKNDLMDDRETFYRKLEILKSQGITLSPTLTVHTNAMPNNANEERSGVNEGSQGSSLNSPTGGPMLGIGSGARTLPSHKNTRNTPPIVKRDSSSTLPSHLISATNQQKGPVNVKQQLPLKLAKLSSGSSSSSGSMTSSLSGSMGGGSMSPSEHRSSSRELSREPSRGSLNTGGVSQILPAKLMEGMGGGEKSSTLDSRVGSRFSQGYQRLHSPPSSASISPSSNPPSSTFDQTTHSRTGSSPASLQNGKGSQLPSPQNNVTNRNPNAYPNIPNKPSNLSQTTGKNTNIPTNVNNTRPGQKIKDPDTNEDIMFF